MTLANRPLLATSVIAIALVVSACRPLAGASPSEAPPSPTASASEAASAAPEPTASPTEPSSPTPTAAPSGDATAPFPVTPNADADALFLERDSCTNADDGFRVGFPDAWWTNTAIGDVTPCNWFAPTTFDVPDPSEVPAEIAITITWMAGDSGSLDEELSREWGLVGGTQAAVRVEYERADGGRYYRYQVQLGPTPEEGPNLLAETSTDMAGDYELNKAVLDRIMATMELLGSIE
jgi:hypothetical protein